MTESLTLVIFGGAGDLARRLLLPGLAEHLALAPDTEAPDTEAPDTEAPDTEAPETDLPETDVTVIGVGRSEHGDYRDMVAESLREAGIEDPAARRLVDASSWRSADATDPEDLAALLSDLTGRIILYFALSPSITQRSVEALAGIDLPEGLEYAMEKPFGSDADSARELTGALNRLTDEDHIFRVDHFLGMTGTVNLDGLLETNRPLAATWNAGSVESVEIVFDETLGLEGRAEFYDATGAARDMLQSHLLQVMAHALADPADGPAGAATILESTGLAGDVADCARRARYTAGTVGGKDLPDYAAEEGVDPGRGTETLAQVTLAVDTEAWRGVPVTLRSGKAIGDPRQEITGRYRAVGNAPGTVLRIELDDDDVLLEINVSDPSRRDELQRATMHTRLVPSQLSAYGRVVRALLDRDPAVQVHAEAAVQGWRILQPVLDAFAAGTVPLEEYPAGSGGPVGW